MKDTHSHTHCHSHHGYGHENHAFEGINAVMHDAANEILKNKVKSLIEKKGGGELDKMAEHAAGLFLSHMKSINNEYSEFLDAHKEHCK